MLNKILFRLLATVLVFVTGNTFAQSINYYFDAAKGNNNNTGTSEAKPFKTFKKLSHLEVNGGDSILLKSGVIFTDSLFFGEGIAGQTNCDWQIWRQCKTSFKRQCYQFANGTYL